MADPKKGTGKKPKGSGRRLYTDENPKDTVKIKFATGSVSTGSVLKGEATFMETNFLFIKLGET